MLWSIAWHENKYIRIKFGFWCQIITLHCAFQTILLYWCFDEYMLNQTSEQKNKQKIQKHKKLLWCRTITCYSRECCCNRIRMTETMHANLTDRTLLGLTSMYGKQNALHDSTRTIIMWQQQQQQNQIEIFVPLLMKWKN